MRNEDCLKQVAKIAACYTGEPPVEAVARAHALVDRYLAPGWTHRNEPPSRLQEKQVRLLDGADGAGPACRRLMVRALTPAATATVAHHALAIQLRAAARAVHPAGGWQEAGRDVDTVADMSRQVGFDLGHAHAALGARARGDIGGFYRHLVQAFVLADAPADAAADEARRTAGAFDMLLAQAAAAVQGTQPGSSAALEDILANVSCPPQSRFWDAIAEPLATACPTVLVPVLQRADAPEISRAVLETAASTLHASCNNLLLQKNFGEAAACMQRYGELATAAGLPEADAVTGLARALQARERGDPKTCYEVLAGVEFSGNTTGAVFVALIYSIACPLDFFEQDKFDRRARLIRRLQVPAESKLWTRLVDTAGTEKIDIISSMLLRARPPACAADPAMHKALLAQELTKIASALGLGSWNVAFAAMDLLSAFMRVSRVDAPAGWNAVRTAVWNRWQGDIGNFYLHLEEGLQTSAARSVSRAMWQQVLEQTVARDARDSAACTHIVAWLQQTPLKADSIVGAKIYEQAIAHKQDGLREALLDAGIQTRIDKAVVVGTALRLQELETQRADVMTYTFNGTSYVYALNPRPTLPLTPRFYQHTQIAGGREIEGLRDLAESNSAILGMTVDTRAKCLRLLVAGGTGPYQYVLERGTDLTQVLKRIAARHGAPVAYAVHRGNTYAGPEHLVIADYAAHRAVACKHMIVTDTESAVQSAAQDGWRLHGMVPEPQVGGSVKYTLLFSRAKSATSAQPVVYLHEAMQAPLALLRRALMAGQWESAVRHVAVLAATPGAPGPRVAHSAALQEILRGMRLQPWKALVRLADLGVLLAQDTGDAESVAMVADMLETAYRALRDIFGQDDIAPLCEAVRAHGELPQAQRVWLALCAGRACDPTGKDAFKGLDLQIPDTVMSAPLLAAVTHESVAGVSFLIALGADPDCALKHADYETPRERAIASGHPALCDAIDGNVYAAREWALLGPTQRAVLVERGKHAARASADKTPALLQKLLDLGEPSESLAALRAYVRRRAPLWINFNPQPTNGLLGSAIYRPKGSGSAKWADKYSTAKPAESPVIYGWVNAQKSIVGYRSYGTASLVLQDHVRARITVVARGVAERVTEVGTLHALDHVLVAFSDATLTAFLAAMCGEKSERTSQVALQPAHQLIEMHVHGPLHLRRDARKINIASDTNLPPEGLRALRAFAQRNGLPLRWRDCVVFKPNENERVLQTLGAAGVDVAAWEHIGEHGAVVSIQPGRFARAGAASYDLQKTAWSKQKRTITDIGHAGGDIVGYHAESGNGPERVVQLCTRFDDDGTPRAYGLYRTQQLQARLEYFAANQWELMAFHQTRSDVSVTPDAVLVARQTEAPWDYMVVNAGPRNEDTIRNIIATHARDGWRVAGRHTDSSAGRLIFKRLRSDDVVVSYGAVTPAPLNATTLLMEPLEGIPQALRFTTHDNYVFDVEELVTLAEEKGLAVNGWTNMPLSDADLDRLMQHPSGAGARLAAMAGDNATLLARLTPAMADAMEALSQVLAGDPATGPMARSVQATSAFLAYVNGPDVTAAGRIALMGARFELTDTHGTRFFVTAMGAVLGLQTGAGCSLATSRYLKTMAERIRTQRFT